MIDIETLILKQMAKAANSALGEILTADATLQMVTEHNDWGCKERDTINDSIRSSRANMKRIAENGTSFYQAVSDVTDDFDKTEKEIGGLFDGLEGHLADILNAWKKPVNPRTPSASNGWAWIPPDIVTDQSSNVFQKITKPISVVAFQDFLKGMEE